MEYVPKYFKPRLEQIEKGGYKHFMLKEIMVPLGSMGQKHGLGQVPKYVDLSLFFSVEKDWLGATWFFEWVVLGREPEVRGWHMFLLPLGVKARCFQGGLTNKTLRLQGLRDFRDQHWRQDQPNAMRNCLRGRIYQPADPWGGSFGACFAAFVGCGDVGQNGIYHQLVGRLGQKRLRPRFACLGSAKPRGTWSWFYYALRLSCLALERVFGH